MTAERLPNGNILIPVRAESEDGKTIGDTMVEITPEHPAYKAWNEYLRHSEPDSNTLSTKSI